LTSGTGYEAMILEPKLAVGRIQAREMAKRLLNAIGLAETNPHRYPESPESCGIF
jgi:hypothetical protein